MVPYVEIPSLQIWGPIVVHPFGFLVVTGCIVGAMVARWHAKSIGLDVQRFSALIGWVLISGLLVSHFITLLFYHPEQLRFDWKLLDVGKGMSSFGGFFGGALGTLVYLRLYRLPILPFVDALVLGLVVGWFFGRLGCTVAHDHPGLPSSFFLAVAYPTGPRHDLGFYEWLFTIGLNILLFTIRSRGCSVGILTGVTCVIYCPVRFLLDFLREGDKLYFGFTPGQYFSLVLMIIGGVVLIRAIRQRKRTLRLEP